ncbi:helix-turn-helix domain-containing protein [Ktedonobacter robiniae]|uniref:helix-turn-helix domain-containing protein n=1 Tax=Ktedonobacter robiniae TaxID=2778365 RepID=UPI001F4679F4|nr:helix-turn-helix domain-containing protein [Ktedonobacter robiniae]
MEAQDEGEERQVRKLAASHHAPADWKFYAKMVVESWAGKTPQEIATTLSCHPRTVRIHLTRFTVEGVNGLGMREGIVNLVIRTKHCSDH